MVSRRSRLLTSLLACLLAGGFSVGTATVAVAQAQAQSQSQSQRRGAAESPVAERQRLRRALDDVQAEIDQLKNADRGLRTDYRLRGRMADAEALARRLTELDAMIGRSGESGKSGTSNPPPALAAPAVPTMMTEPAAAPTDGPAELEAKADILADQSRRVQLQIVALKTRIDQVRGRQELRRRTRQMDSDPFAPLEGSKRRVVTSSAVAATPALPGRQGAGDQAPSVVTVGATGPAPGPSAGFTPPAGAPATPVAPVATSVQLRDTLDPNTLAQIHKLEQDGSGAANLESMERAVAALTARARHLDAQSKLLRTQAHAR